MSLPPNLQSHAGALASLMAEALGRDGDGLVVADAATGAWLHLSAPMGRWLGTQASALDAPEVARLLGGAASAVRAADATAALADAATTQECKMELAEGRREFSIWRRRLGSAWVLSVWRDLTSVRTQESRLRNAIEQLEREQQTNERLRQEAQGQSPRDNATGLYNRAHFDDQLRREVDLSTREHREFALVAIEIDPAPAGAAHSPEALDRIVQAMGRLLRGNTRAMDASCRYEERRFAVLLSGVGLATAHSRMEGLRRQCATQIVALQGREIGFTVSMGVASFPHTAQTQDEVRAACEAALTDARHHGGNRVTLASIRFGE
jgi:diguanylate cyclase (GGDEF)-like protein